MAASHATSSNPGLRREGADDRSPLLAQRVAQLNSSLLSVRANASSISSASSSSRQPLPVTFGTLTRADVAFFDVVVASLPRGAADFTSLKRAYNAARALPLPKQCDEQKDAFLWDKTLCLVQVRGHDWSSRWDAVRIALGLEPRSTSSGEDPTLRSEDASESSEEDVTTGGSADELERWRLQAAHNNLTRTQGRTTAGSAILSGGGRQLEQQSKLRSLAAQARALSLQTARHHGQRNDTRMSANESPERRAHVETASDSSTLAASATQAKVAQQKPADISPPMHREDRRKARADRTKHSESESDLQPESRVATQNEVQRRFAAVIARSREERAALAAAEAERVALAEEEAHAPARRLAEQHHRRKLLRPSFDWWRQRCDRLHANADRVDRAHERIVVAKALRHWLQRREASLQALNAAGGVDRVRCVLGAWRVWRRLHTLRKERQKEARIAELKSAWDAIKSKRDKKAKEGAWRDWRSRFLHRFAGRLREEHLYRGAFSMWSLALARSRRLKSAATALDEQRTRNRLAGALGYWYQRMVSRQAEREVRQRSDERLARGIFEHWRQQGKLSALGTKYLALRIQRTFLNAWRTAASERADQVRREALADRWRVRRSKRQAVSRWQDQYQQFQDMQHTAESLLVIRDERLQHRMLAQWMLEERLVLLRRVHNSRTLANALGAWKQAKSSLAVLLEPKAEHVEARMRRKSLSHAWSVWRRRHSEYEQDTTEAHHLYARRALLKGVEHWRMSLESKYQMQRRAAQVADFVGLRGSWQAWAARLRERRCSQLMSRTAAIGAKAAFNTWRARTSERAQERATVSRVTARREERMLRLSLKQWTKTVVDRRSQALGASERWDSMMLRGAWSQWVAACVRHEDLINLGRSFADVKKEENTRRIFHNWLSRMRTSRDHRVAAEAFRTSRDRRKLEDSWELWADKHYDVSLRPLEYEVVMRRQEGAARAAMRKWQAGTRVLPALKFDRQRLVMHTWKKWRETLPVAVTRRQALDRDRQHMLGKAFYHWIKASKAKRSMRAAARFGGPSVARLRAAAQVRRVSPFMHGTSSSPNAMGGVRDTNFGPTSPRSDVTSTPQVQSVKSPRLNDSILTSAATQSPVERRASEATLAQLAASPLRRLRSVNASADTHRRPPLEHTMHAVAAIRREAGETAAGAVAQSRSAIPQNERSRDTGQPAAGRMFAGASSALSRWAHGVAASAGMHVPRQDSLDFSEGESEATERRPIAKSITSPSSTSALLEATSARRQEARRQPSPAPSRAQSVMDDRALAARKVKRQAEADREARKQEDVLQLLRARRRQRALQPEGATDTDE